MRADCKLQLLHREMWFNLRYSSKPSTRFLSIEIQFKEWKQLPSQEVRHHGIWANYRVLYLRYKHTTEVKMNTVMSISTRKKDWTPMQTQLYSTIISGSRSKVLFRVFQQLRTTDRLRELDHLFQTIQWTSISQGLALLGTWIKFLLKATKRTSFHLEVRG